MKESAYFASRLLSKILCVLDHAAFRVVAFLAVCGWIASKSFFDPDVHWRTAGDFIFLSVGLALLLRSRDKWSAWAGSFVILLLVFSIFFWRLQGFDTDGFTITGVLPQSDANGYYTGALKMLYGEKIPAFAARRPLFVAFLSTLLYAFQQNLFVVLAAMSLFVSISIYLLMKEIRNGFGAFPAAFTAMSMVYCYTGKFAGKFLTEQLGLPLGVLALALFLNGIRTRRFHYLLLALFALSLALNARAGAFFVLPFLVVWVAALKGVSLSSMLRLGALAAGAVGLGFAVNFWLFGAVSAPGSVPYGNFGVTLYGMATGYRGWRAFYVDFGGSAVENSTRIALDIIRESPDVFLRAVWQAYREFFAPSRFFSFLYLPSQEIGPLAVLLSLLAILGLIQLVRHRRTPFARMMLLTVLGIVLSVPFAPPIDDGIRAMVSTTAFLALLTGLPLAGFAPMASSFRDDSSAGPKADSLLIFSSVIVLTVSLGWLLVRGPAPSSRPTRVCGPGETFVSVAASPGSYVNIVRNSSQAYSLLPNIRRVDLRENLANFSSFPTYDAFGKLEPGQTVMLGVNLADLTADQPVWLILPTEAVQTWSGVNQFCVVRTGVDELDRFNYFIDPDLKETFLSRE